MSLQRNSLFAHVLKKCIKSDAVRPLSTYAKGIRCVIAVSGATAVGKTTFCRKFQEFLATRGIRAEHVMLDGFLMDRSERNRRRLSGYDPRCTDWKALLATLETLIVRGIKAAIPEYHHGLGKKRETGDVRPAEVVLLDGVTAINPKVSMRFSNYRIFFEAEDLVLKELRVKVEVGERGYSESEALRHADKELGSYHKFIRPHCALATLRIAVGRNWVSRIDPKASSQ